jgi:cell division protein FtsZ
VVVQVPVQLSNCSTAKERDILTVGIVTLPFLFEGKKSASRASFSQIEKLRKQVGIIVISNNKLRSLWKPWF